jgi:hypothetical protein
MIGYARVSTDGQTLAAQTEALHACGCARIFAEKISGAYSDRPQLAKAIAALAEGDTLVVCKRGRATSDFWGVPWPDRQKLKMLASRRHNNKQNKDGDLTNTLEEKINCSCSILLGAVWTT